MARSRRARPRRDSPAGRKALGVVVPIALLAFSKLSIGHHSVAAIYDHRETVTLEGELLAVDWRNPHIEIQIRVDDGSATGTVWDIHGPGPSFFREGEFPRDRFERWIGAAIIVRAYPARSGSTEGAMVQVALPDGETPEMDPEG